jgi:hypothetical protein
VIATLVRAAAVFTGGAEPEGARREALERRIRAILAALPSDRRRLLAAGALALEWLPMLRFGRRFRALDAPRAEAWLRFLQRAPATPLRRLHASLKLLLQYAWYLDPATHAETDYDGPWLGRVDVAAGPPPKLDAAPAAVSGADA